MVWRQRVKELESSTKRDSEELVEVATLLARADKHANWAHRQYRSQRRKTLATERGLTLARCCLVEARIRERLAHWARTDAVSGGAGAAALELEQDLVKLLEEMLELVEQVLKPKDASADPLDEPFAARHRGSPDDSPSDPESMPDPEPGP